MMTLFLSLTLALILTLILRVFLAPWLKRLPAKSSTRPPYNPPTPPDPNHWKEFFGKTMGNGNGGTVIVCDGCATPTHEQWVTVYPTHPETSCPLCGIHYRLIDRGRIEWKEPCIDD